MRFAKTIGIPPGAHGRLLAGAFVTIAVAAIIIGVLISIQHADTGEYVSARIDIAHLLRMTIIQAGLTTILSLFIGTGIAWALDRLRFPGRTLIIALFSVAIVTPGIVVAVGLLSVWGRNGWFNHLLEPFGISIGSSIYGLPGILAAHLVLDGAFAAHIMLNRLQAIPNTRLKTGQGLGLDPWQRFTTIDWPAISSSIPGIAAIIFLMAFTSFPIVLILGGGPANQTFEVAIYTAVRLDFDLGASVKLSLVQLAVCAAVIIPAAAVSVSTAGAGTTLRSHRWADNKWATRLQITVLTLAVIGFALPLFAVAMNGITAGIGDLLTNPTFWKATLTSLTVGASSALLTLAMAMALALARAETGNPILRATFGMPAFAYHAIPAVVLGLGFFLGIRTFGMPTSTMAPFVLVLANALLALPLAVSTLGPQIDALNRRYSRINRSLGITGFTRLRLVEWPMLGREIGTVLALGFCFSLGDLGVISLFGTQDFTTLPWLMVRALGSYRTNDAAIIAALILFLCLAAFTALPALTQRLSHAET